MNIKKKVNYHEFPFQCLMETNFTQGQRVFEYHVYYINISIYYYIMYNTNMLRTFIWNGQSSIRLPSLCIILIICFTVNSILNIIGWLILGYNKIIFCIQGKFQGFYIIIFGIGHLIIVV